MDGFRARNGLEGCEAWLGVRQSRFIRFECFSRNCSVALDVALDFNRVESWGLEGTCAND